MSPALSYWAGNMAHYLLTRNQTYIDNAVAWGEHFKWETCNYPHTLDEHAAANDYLCTQSYVQLAMLKKDTAYIKNSIEVLKVVVNRQAVDDFWCGQVPLSWFLSLLVSILPSLAANLLRNGTEATLAESATHPPSFSRRWIDAFFMGLPSFAALYNATGDTSFTEKMFLLFNDTSMNRTMWDAEVCFSIMMTTKQSRPTLPILASHRVSAQAPSLSLGTVLSVLPRPDVY